MTNKHCDGCETFANFSNVRIALNFSDFAITAQLAPDFFSPAMISETPSLVRYFTNGEDIFRAEELTARCTADGEDEVFVLVPTAHRAIVPNDGSDPSCLRISQSQPGFADIIIRLHPALNVSADAVSEPRCRLSGHTAVQDRSSVSSSVCCMTSPAPNDRPGSIGLDSELMLVYHDSVSLPRGCPR